MTQDEATGSVRARWRGDLYAGSGTIAFDSGAYTGEFSRASRWQGSGGTNPEEMLAGAQAACLTMTLAAMLAAAGHAPRAIELDAAAVLSPRPEGGFEISRVIVAGTVVADELSAAGLDAVLAKAKAACPVSNALAGTKIELDVALGE